MSPLTIVGIGVLGIIRSVLLKLDNSFHLTSQLSLSASKLRDLDIMSKDKPLVLECFDFNTNYNYTLTVE
ncbi:hypothetical protein QVD17_09276 [Tagetes erecta]|uniref:Uncharacterized protein n=1 Tax=Tagetes erecta TaxID=13708 RepID=A0AAD8KZ14_TARER|nr:hypothetical protein QVD17_09276 [Tagetes erecta]